MIGPPELQLIQSTLRVDDERDAAIRDAARQRLDWAKVQSLAQHHGVSPMVYQRLKEVAPDLVPSAVLQQMAAFQKANELRVIQMTADLIKVVRALEAEGIPVLCLKGPVLAQVLYGDPALRLFGDLDILVHEADSNRAAEVLLKTGLFPCNRDQTLPIFSTEDLKATREAVFIFPHKNFILELHWRVNTPELPDALATNELFLSPQIVRVNDHDLLTLSPDDMAIYLCHHGTQHCWEKFRYLTDFSNTYDPLNSTQREQAIKDATAQSLSRSLSICTYLSYNLLGMQETISTTDKINLGSRDRKIVSRITNTLKKLSQDRWSAVRHRVFRLNISDQCNTQQFEIIKLYVRHACYLMSVSDNDRAWVILPRSLAWLYFFLRPFRLTHKVITNHRHRAK